MNKIQSNLIPISNSNKPLLYTNYLLKNILVKVTMESDERFKHLTSDPRFKTLRKKQKKVQIDDRFKSMFTDKKFTLKYTKDKRGRSQKKTSGDDLKRYYSLPDEKGENERDKEEDEHESASSNGEESCLRSDIGTDDQTNHSESELSSSSDESESELEEETLDNQNVIDLDRLNYDWQPLDHDAETTEVTTKRLAIQNLDWDYLDVKDIYTLIHSVRPPLCVKVYVSEFGKERLKREAIEGPKEIVEMPKVDEEEEEYNQLKNKMRALKNQEPKSHRVNEYEDADEEMDPKNEEVRERIRKYQLNRMKYYYAIVEFDSIESSELVYRELDGREYEGSSLELDLRFVPDDVEFEEEDVKAKCDKLPDLTSYQAPQFINSALQQTTVKFTWDETDARRQDKLLKAYTKEELDKDDLEAYLASETDSVEELEDEEMDEFREGDAVSIVTANSEARANKYKMLLQSLEEEEQQKKKLDVDVEWGIHKEAEKNQTEDAGLDLLVMDAHSDNFQFDPDDERFKAIYESPLYNIDPSHPNFKRTRALEMVAEKKRQKRKGTL